MKARAAGDSECEPTSVLVDVLSESIVCDRFAEWNSF